MQLFLFLELRLGGVLFLGLGLLRFGQLVHGDALVLQLLLVLELFLALELRLILKLFLILELLLALGLFLVLELLLVLGLFLDGVLFLGLGLLGLGQQVHGDVLVLELFLVLGLFLDGVLFLGLGLLGLGQLVHGDVLILELFRVLGLFLVLGLVLALELLLVLKLFLALGLFLVLELLLFLGLVLSEQFRGGLLAVGRGVDHLDGDVAAQLLGGQNPVASVVLIFIAAVGPFIDLHHGAGTIVGVDAVRQLGILAQFVQTAALGQPRLYRRQLFRQGQIALPGMAVVVPEVGVVHAHGTGHVDGGGGHGARHRPGLWGGLRQAAGSGLGCLAGELGLGRPAGGDIRGGPLGLRRSAGGDIRGRPLGLRRFAGGDRWGGRGLAPLDALALGGGGRLQNLIPGGEFRADAPQLAASLHNLFHIPEYLRVCLLGPGQRRIVGVFQGRTVVFFLGEARLRAVAGLNAPEGLQGGAVAVAPGIPLLRLDQVGISILKVISLVEGPLPQLGLVGVGVGVFKGVGLVGVVALVGDGVEDLPVGVRPGAILGMAAEIAVLQQVFIEPDDILVGIPAAVVIVFHRPHHDFFGRAALLEGEVLLQGLYGVAFGFVVQAVPGPGGEEVVELAAAFGALFGGGILEGRGLKGGEKALILPGLLVPRQQTGKPSHGAPPSAEPIPPGAAGEQIEAVGGGAGEDVQQLQRLGGRGAGGGHDRGEGLLRQLHLGQGAVLGPGLGGLPKRGGVVVLDAPGPGIAQGRVYQLPGDELRGEGREQHKMTSLEAAARSPRRSGGRGGAAIFYNIPHFPPYRKA